MRLGMVIQARMRSQRLPGKVLRPVAGRPLLGYLIERLERGENPIPVVVATSKLEQDDPVARFCAQKKVDCFRGDHLDVAHRFLEVSSAYGFDGIVRVSGDSPLLDQRLVDRAVDLFRQGRVDLVTNIFPRSYPRGQSVEVFDTLTFERAYERMSEPEDFEHVTRIFYRTPGDYVIKNIATTKRYDRIHMAVDTPEDLQRFEAIIQAMNGPHWRYGLEDVAQLFRKVAGLTVVSPL